MAFFATIEDLPAAKLSWKTRPPEPPEPPIIIPPKPRKPYVPRKPPGPCHGVEYINGMDIGHMCLETVTKYNNEGHFIPEGMVLYRRLEDQAAIDAIPPERLKWRSPTGNSRNFGWYEIFHYGDDKMIQTRFPPA